MGDHFRRGIFSVSLSLWFLFSYCSSGHHIKTEPGDMESINKEVCEKRKWITEKSEFENRQVEEVLERELKKAVDLKKLSDPPFVQNGVASWYGEKFQGRRTANGEVYDMYRLTAAHKTLPFNSIVEVENLENHSKTIVRINDRGPFIKNRIIDLSLKAARLLGMAEKGTASVRIRLLKTPDISGKNWEQSIDRGYYIQAGAFLRRANARNLLKQLNETIREIKFEIYIKNGYHKLISEKVSSRRDAERIKRILEGYGISVFIKGLNY
ncbi:MAG: septal ring lytic transglycosylase RlpA family protein [Candidatus Aminicenantes bacterium]|nr:septal ring lytic transglycosylase RlpA family protein [Candidatus Aminicenantes bacterium]